MQGPHGIETVVSSKRDAATDSDEVNLLDSPFHDSDSTYHDSDSTYSESDGAHSDNQQVEADPRATRIAQQERQRALRAQRRAR